jgi:Tfp pilus assembly protein PilO
VNWKLTALIVVAIVIVAAVVALGLTSTLTIKVDLPPTRPQSAAPGH